MPLIYLYIQKKRWYTTCMIKLVLVDFDDTLCMTEEACFHLENEIAKQLGFPPMDRKAHQSNWGKALKDAIVERIPGIDSDAFMKLFPAVSKKYVDQGTFDQVSQENLDILIKLQETGHKVVIQTSRQGYEVGHLIAPESPIMKIVDGFFYQDRYVYKKPDPRVFHLPERVFNVDFAEMVYVGDAFMDVQWCRAGGVHFIASLESGLRTKADFEKLGAKWFINKFTELPDRIKEIDQHISEHPQAFTSKAVL